jgi:AcrR family transcriptional regulator
MTEALHVVEDPIGAEEVGARWRTDLDPGALPPTPTRSPGQRRIMRASLVHFAARGFGGSNLRDIAGTLGIQAASVYKHFPSKEAILEALVTLGYDVHQAAVTGAALAAPSTPQDQLAAFMRAHIGLHCTYPRLGAVVHHEWWHLAPQAMAGVERQIAQTDGVLLGIMQRGVDSGVFTIENPELTLVAITGLGMSGALWFPWQTDVSAEQVIERFTQAALDLCRCHEARS